MKIREPAVQGTFYPLERQVLYKMVENFINNSPVKFENGKIYGIYVLMQVMFFLVQPQEYLMHL